MSVEVKTKSVLDSFLDSAFAIFTPEFPPPLDAISSFEADVGIRLPLDFKAFSTSRFGGIYIEVKESIWARPEPGCRLPFWQFQYGILTYGFDTNAPDFLNIRIAENSLRRQTGKTYVPFLKVVGERRSYCYDPEGSPCVWDPDVGAVSYLQSDFFSIFSSEVKGLRERKDRLLSP